MATVRDVLAALERIAPTRFAFPWDKVGLQVGDESQQVERAIVSLDRSLGAIEFAQDARAQLLLSHHPLIFEPLSSVTDATYEGRSIRRLIEVGIAHIAAHTNWDAAVGGINDALAERLGLGELQPFGSSAERRELKLVTFAPPESVDAIIDACSAAGAGIIGNYRRCAFTSTGRGTFEAGPGANPTLGEPGQRTTVEEISIEMVCPLESAQEVATAITKTHPYEEPAIDWIPLRASSAQPMGRIGTLDWPMNLVELASIVDQALDTRSIAWGRPDRQIRRIAVVGGAADGEWRAAKSAGADVLITGEVKQHVAAEVSESDFAIIGAGHYATEQPGCAAMRARMEVEIPDVEWILYTPERGFSGRPL